MCDWRIPAEQIKSEDAIGKELAAKKDPIYGDALPRTWNWLCEHVQSLDFENEETTGVVDFGFQALDRLLPTEPEAIQLLHAPSSAAPVMLPVHVDCWVPTAPRPEPILMWPCSSHGPDRGQAEVQVCWAKDLGLDVPGVGRRERWDQRRGLMPTHGARVLASSAGPRSRLAARNRAADRRGLRNWRMVLPRQQGRDHLAACGPPLVAGPESKETDLIRDVRQLRPGDTLVIPAEESGWQVMGQISAEDNEPGDEGTSLDIADLSFRISRQRALLPSIRH